MPKVQVQTEIDLNQLLSQLDTEALEKLLLSIPEIIGQRKSDDTPVSESHLLERLNSECSLPKEHWNRVRTLNRKKEEGRINNAEIEELLQLAKEEESLRAKRILILGKLAQLKGVSIIELSNELDLNPD